MSPKVEACQITGERDQLAHEGGNGFRSKVDASPQPEGHFRILAKNGVQVPPEITMEWCPLKTNVTVVPPHDSVFIYPQILAR